MTTSVAPGRTVVLRALALAALIVGLVMMHHVAGAATVHAAAHSSTRGTLHHDDGTGATSVAGSVGAAHGHHASDHPADDGAEAAHDASGGHLLHLCLAVLTAAVMVLAVWSWRRLRPLRRDTRWSGVRRLRPPRPVGRHGFDLLISLCVMRT